MNILQQLSEELFHVIDSVISEEHLIKINDNLLEWETDNGRFRYNSETQTMYVQPKINIESLDLKITILPSNYQFNME
jgi:hypothetical protein